MHELRFLAAILVAAAIFYFQDVLPPEYKVTAVLASGLIFIVAANLYYFRSGSRK
jgi:hypothetical protein